jgi:hypothetical protein
MTRLEKYWAVRMARREKEKEEEVEVKASV